MYHFLNIVGALTSLLAFVPLFPSGVTASHGSFQLEDCFIGDDFFHNFVWETANDPTHGRVNYVDQATAITQNLAEVKDGKFFMRADSTKVLQPGDRGRDSNRITSQKSYTDSVLVIDLEHMPEGCSTWPAFWTVTNGNWPNGGEIDIIEGVNTNTQNLVSLHTTPNCTMPAQTDQLGSQQSGDCDALVNGNQGCGTNVNKPNSYGTDFNENKGGWYVMKRTQEDGVYAWFWDRYNPNVPREVAKGESSISPETWGTPDVRYPSSDSCDFASHFSAHNIVFDLTFCGDWAGNTFGQTSCGANSNSCQNFVDNNPSAFANAYWSISSLRVYTPSGSTIPPQPTSTPSTVPASGSSGESEPPSGSSGILDGLPQLAPALPLIGP